MLTLELLGKSWSPKQETHPLLNQNMYPKELKLFFPITNLGGDPAIPHASLFPHSASLHPSLSSHNAGCQHYNAANGF